MSSSLHNVVVEKQSEPLVLLPSLHLGLKNVVIFSEAFACGAETVECQICRQPLKRSSVSVGFMSARYI